MDRDVPIPRDVNGRELDSGYYFRIEDVFGADFPSLIQVIRKGNRLSSIHLLGEVRSL